MKTKRAESRKRAAALTAVALAAVLLITLFAFGGKPGAARVGAAENAADANYLHYWYLDGNLDDASGKLHVAPMGGDAAYTGGRSGNALDTVNGAAVRSEELTENTVSGFTMGAWFTLAEGAEEWNIIMSKGDTIGAAADRFQIHIGHASPDAGGGTLLTYVPAANNGFANEDDGPFVPYDTWTHVAVTYNGSVLRFFVNGELYGEKAVSAPLQKSAKLNNTVTIGALNHDGTTFRFDGLIDDAFYANFAMKPEDIAAAYNDNTKLKNWSNGTQAITPDVPDGPVVTPAPTEPPEAVTSEGNMVLYWPMDGNTEDYSHYRADLDFNETDPSFTDVKLNGGVELMDGMLTDGLPAGIDLTEFTLSFWLQWEEMQNQNFAVLFSIADKSTDHHFELYLYIDGDTDVASLCSYNTGTGQDVRGLAEINRGVLYHIACTSGAGGFVVYLNGEEVYRSGMARRVKGLDPDMDCISLGSLSDMQLLCEGNYDEIILADSVFSAEQIKKLYEDPAGAREDVIKLIEANYPEGYVRPTEKPTNAPTEKPTEAPTPAPTAAPTEPAEDEPTAIPGKTADPSGGEKSDNTGDRPSVKPGVIVAIVAAAVVIVGAVIAAVVAGKKKKGSK